MTEEPSGGLQPSRDRRRHRRGPAAPDDEPRRRRHRRGRGAGPAPARPRAPRGRGPAAGRSSGDDRRRAFSQLRPRRPRPAALLGDADGPAAAGPRLEGRRRGRVGDGPLAADRGHRTSPRTATPVSFADGDPHRAGRLHRVGHPAAAAVLLDPGPARGGGRQGGRDELRVTAPAAPSWTPAARGGPGPRPARHLRLTGASGPGRPTAADGAVSGDGDAVREPLEHPGCVGGLGTGPDFAGEAGVAGPPERSLPPVWAR